MIYYIADIHFQDLRIFNVCKKPFKDLNEYQEEIIKRWNNKVGDNDSVYILGDIGEDNHSDAVNIFKKLKGEKYLIIGNHDLKILDRIIASNVFKTVKYMDFIYDKGRFVHLCHYPLMDWLEFDHGSYHVYGHIHNKNIQNCVCYGKMKEYYRDKKAYNCGVDVTNFEPVTLDEMIKLKEINKNETYIN